MLGIDKVKKLGGYIINDIVEPLQKYLADGKFSVMEVLQFSYQQLPAVGLWGDRDEIVAQIKDIDNDEIEEIIDHIVSEYDYSNEKARKIVTAIANFFKAGNDLVEAFNE